MSKKRKKPEPTSWIVEAIVTRKVTLVAEGCTRDQAEDDGQVMSYVVDETVSETTDWEVLSVEPND